MCLQSPLPLEDSLRRQGYAQSTMWSCKEVGRGVESEGYKGVAGKG